MPNKLFHVVVVSVTKIIVTVPNHPTLAKLTEGPTVIMYMLNDSDTSPLDTQVESVNYFPI